jgi:hypothetical protein
MAGLLKTPRQFAIAALGVLLVASVAAAQATNAMPRPPVSKERGWKVTAVFLELLLSGGNIDKCPEDKGFLGRITTDGPAEVKYTWVSSDGRTWPEQSLKFPRGRGKNVTVVWKVGKPGETVKV